jgi:hypothetical protein
METTLSASFQSLTAELRSFGTSKGVKLKYLQDQYKSRNIRMKGMYLSIPSPSDYRSKSKPYKLRMQPHPLSACKPSTDAQIAYLLQLLKLMMHEDAGRNVQATVTPEDNSVVRRLPVVSETYINPISVRLKQEQEARVAAMAAPTDNPWLANYTPNTSANSCTTAGSSGSSTSFTSITKAAEQGTHAGRPRRSQYISPMMVHG